MADIKGNNIGAPITPFTTDDIYNTHFAKYGQGGLQSAATVAERDAILLSRREWGMEVNLPAGTKYVLVKGLVDQNLLNNANWKEVVGGEGETYDDTELQERMTTLEADLTDAENAILDLENQQDKYVLKQVGKQLTDQNYTLEEKEKLAASLLAADLPAALVEKLRSQELEFFEVPFGGGAVYVSLKNDAIADYHLTPELRDQIQQGGGQNTPAYTTLSNRVTAVETGKVDKVAGSSLMTQAERDKLAAVNSLTNAYLSAGNNLVLQGSVQDFTVAIPTTSPASSGPVLSGTVAAFSQVVSGGSKTVQLPAGTTQVLTVGATHYAFLSPDDYTLDLTAGTLTVQLAELVDGDKVWGTALVGTAPSTSGSAATYIEIKSTQAARVAELPVPFVFSITAEVLDVNATGISYQLDKNTRTGTRAYGSPSRTRAQVNALLSTLTPAELAAGVKLYCSTVPTTAANASVVGLTLQ